MTPRFAYTTTSPNPYDAMRGLEDYLASCTIEKPLRLPCQCLKLFEAQVPERLSLGRGLRVH